VSTELETIGLDELRMRTRECEKLLRAHLADAIGREVFYAACARTQAGDPQPKSPLARRAGAECRYWTRCVFDRRYKKHADRAVVRLVRYTHSQFGRECLTAVIRASDDEAELIAADSSPWDKARTVLRCAAEEYGACFALLHTVPGWSMRN
jgi:hypothetical protein